MEVRRGPQAQIPEELAALKGSQVQAEVFCALAEVPQKTIFLIPACSSSMVEKKSGFSGFLGPWPPLVVEAAVPESKGWAYGLGSEPIGARFLLK